jgi:hypothetical protein
LPAITSKGRESTNAPGGAAGFGDGRPVVVDVHVIPDEMRTPWLQSYQKADGSIVSKPLEDMFPFLPREEFLANMIVKPLEE